MKRIDACDGCSNDRKCQHQDLDDCQACEGNKK